MVNNDYTAKYMQSLMYIYHPSQLYSDYKICYELDLNDYNIATQRMPMTMKNYLSSIQLPFKH